MSSSVTFDRFVIDRDALELRRDGERVALAPQAVRALLVLVDRAGTLVTREELYAALWPEPDVDVDRGLNTLIRQIRIALDDSANEPRFIRTYPRRGYRFLEQKAAPQRRTRALVVRVAPVAAAVVALVAVALWTRPPNPVAHADLLAGAELEPASREAWENGLYLMHDPVPERRGEARPYFEAVVAANPGFAPGHARLAGALLWSGETMESRRAAERALELDPDLAYALLVHGTLVLIQDWDWELAESELRRAVRSSPNVAEYHHGYAFLLATAGRHDEAIVELERARSLDPRSAIVNGDLGLIYLYAGRFDEAAESCARAVELEPGAAYADDCAFEAFARAGDAAVAREHARSLLRRAGEDGARVMPASLPDSTAIDRFREWQAERATHDLAHGRMSPFGAALAFAGAGRVDEAVAALERAAAERSLGVVTVTIDPRFAPLHGNARFRRIANKVVAHGAAALES